MVYRILKTALGEGIRPKTGPRITPTFLLIRFQKTLEIGFGGFFGLVAQELLSSASDNTYYVGKGFAS
jgi:hypothetical protein